MGRPKKLHDEYGRPLFTEAGNRLEYWDNENENCSAVHIIDAETGERLGTYNYTFEHTFPVREVDEYDIAASKGLHYQASYDETGKRKIDKMDRFAPVPHNLFTVTKYSKLSSNAKLLYGLMHSRMMMSFNNEKLIDGRAAWWDVYGRIKFYYSRQRTCEMLNISEPVAIKVFKELVKMGLLYEKVNNGYNKPKTLWLLKPYTSQMWLEELQEQYDRYKELDNIGGMEKTKKAMEIEIEAVTRHIKSTDD